MDILGKSVTQYFTVVLFVFQFYEVCNFGNLSMFGLAFTGVKRPAKPLLSDFVKRECEAVLLHVDMSCFTFLLTKHTVSLKTELFRKQKRLSLNYTLHSIVFLISYAAYRYGIPQ